MCVWGGGGVGCVTFSFFSSLRKLTLPFRRVVTIGRRRYSQYISSNNGDRMKKKELPNLYHSTQTLFCLKCYLFDEQVKMKL